MSTPSFPAQPTLLADELDAVLPAVSTSPAARTILPRFERDGDRVRVVREERDRYEIARSLGSGGMGEVQLATDHDIGRKVAIKRLHPELRRPAVVSRFVGEIRTIGQLDHPNIVPVHDVGMDGDGSLFFVMKYVDGETLEGVIERLRGGDPEAHEHWTFERRAQVIRGVLRALQVAHAHGIVHRDVKPSNVMVGRFGEVVLMDWGVARSIGGVELEDDAPSERPVGGTTRVGAVIGTPRYMSPEQLRGEHDHVDGRSDLYALGIVFYELLTLCHPFGDAADLEALQRRTDADPSIPPPNEQHRHPAQRSYAPADLLWLCWRLTHRSPGDRPEDAAAVLRELELIEEGRGRVDCVMTFTKRVARGFGRLVDRYPQAAVASLAGLVLTSAAGVISLVVGLTSLALSLLRAHLT